MPKVLLVEPNPKSAVSFYRSLGTFPYLHKLDSTIRTEQLTVANNWTFFSGADILYMQRPFDPVHTMTIKEAKKCGLKIWIDTDDLLHDVPSYNPNYKVFNNPQNTVIKVFEEAMKLADMVTVTTVKLKDYYSAYNENVRIVENAHNDYMYPFKKFLGDSKPVINWRGSETHRDDLRSVATQIVNLSKQYKDWAWVFIGNNLWFITELIKSKYLEVPEKPIQEYFEIMGNIGSAIQIVPLMDNDFNRAKSAISWYEATYGGMVTIAPDFPEFQKPGCLNYKDAENFGYLLEKCIKSKTFREENYEMSYNYIKNNLLLSQINKKRIDIIYELAER